MYMIEILVYKLTHCLVSDHYNLDYNRLFIRFILLVFYMIHYILDPNLSST